MTRLRPLNQFIPELMQPKPAAATPAAPGPASNPTSSATASPAATPVTAGTQPPSQASAQAPAQVPATSLKADTVMVSGSTPVKLETVRMAPATAPNPAEIRRLLANPSSLSRIHALIEREPKLAVHFSKPGGQEVLALLKTASQRPLKENEIKTLQRFLVAQDGAKIAYRGHATGVDGSYGRLTHGALTALLARPLPATEQPAEPVQNAQPVTQPDTVPSAPVVTEPVAPKPSTPVATDSHSLLESLDASQDLQTLANSLQKLPIEVFQKLASVRSGSHSLAGLLETAAVRKLNKTETQALQGLLVSAGQNLKYRGHATGIDGDFGLRSKQALIAVARERLTGVSAADTKSYPRYERMLEDRLLDMTMAIGFDEGTIEYQNAHFAEEMKITQGLKDRGFVHDDAKAKALLAAAGRTPEAGYAALYVKESIDTRDGQPVHAIVRVVLAGDGSQGAANRKAAIEGMNQSDVFAYGGHGRYGNGPDFDRNFTVTVDWTGVANAPASGKVVYEDYNHLKSLLGGSDAQAIQRLKALDESGKVTLTPSNDGNIRMSEKPMHTYEFGGELTGRALGNTTNTLSEEIKGDNYKLWLFEACRTTDFVQPIRNEARSNSSLNGKNLDLLTTEQMMYWQNTSNSLLTLLDGVLAKDSSEALVSRLKVANPEQAGTTHGAYGFEENPRR